MKILFNVPVHENMDVVVNTVENIKKYVAEPIIVFHVNPVFKDFDKSRLDSYTDVYVNPNHTGTTDQIYTIKPVHRTMSSILRQTINSR